MKPNQVLRTAAVATVASAAALLPLAALAHAGHASTEHSFFAGFAHPFTGIDHLAAMLAVGMWSALSATRGSLLAAPLSFAMLLLVGAVLGIAGIALPAVEPMIATSLLAIGLLAAARTRLAPVIAAIIVGGFALFHGAAHGTELASSNAALALTGMVLATAIIHMIGICAGLGLRHSHHFLTRAAGGAVALFGAALLSGLA